VTTSSTGLGLWQEACDEVGGFPLVLDGLDADLTQDPLVREERKVPAPTGVEGHAWEPEPVDTRQLVQAFYIELWNRWDDTAVDTVLAPDFTFRGSLGNQTRGRAGWREYRDLVRAGSSDFHNDVQALIVDGTQAAARLLYSGTHDGPLAGIAPTGTRFSYAGAAFFASHHGQLTSAWVLGDLVSLRAQLES
jgi:predicted ester cyclase